VLRFDRFGLSRPRQKSVALRAMFFDARADVLSPGSAFSFAHRAHDPGASGSPTGFSVPPIFQKVSEKVDYRKSAPPKRLPATRSRLRSWYPVCAPTTCAKGIRRAFQPSAGGQLLKARQAKTRLDSGCGSGSTQAEP
jgi:hypothetical protein